MESRAAYFVMAGLDPAISGRTGLPGPPDQVRWRAARALRPGHRQSRLGGFSVSLNRSSTKLTPRKSLTGSARIEKSAPRETWFPLLRERPRGIAKILRLDERVRRQLLVRGDRQRPAQLAQRRLVKARGQRTAGADALGQRHRFRLHQLV